MVWKDHGKRPGPKPKRPKGRQPCTFEDCDRLNFGHGLCHTHYMQQRRGVPLRAIRSPRPDDGEGYRWCGSCKQFRDEDEFGWDTTRNQPKRTCRPCHASRMAAYNAANRKTVNLKRRVSKRGISVDDYHALVLAQGGRCAICRRDDRKLDIDHSHQEGHVRALLCSPCNRALGFFNDDPELIHRAEEYLRSH